MTITAVQSATNTLPGHLLRRPETKAPVAQPPEMSVNHDDVRFGSRHLLGWGALALTGLVLTMAKPPASAQVQGQPLPVRLMPPAVKPAEVVEKSVSTKTLDELTAIHGDSKLGSGFSVEKAKKATPLIKEHIKLLADPKADVSIADLDKAATLAISNLYFMTSDVDAAYKAGQRDLTVAVLEWEGALIKRALTTPTKTADERTKTHGIADRLYGDLLWYSCYPESANVWKTAADEYAKQAFEGPGSHRPCCTNRMISALPGNKVAKTLFDDFRTQSEAAIDELSKEKAFENPKRGDWMRTAQITIPVLTLVANEVPPKDTPSHTPKIPAAEQKKLQDWLMKTAHPTLVKVAHKGLATPNLRVPERQFLVGLIAQGVGYEKQIDAIQHQIAVWGYDPTRALLSYPNNMADYKAENGKVRFNTQRYVIDVPKDPRDKEKGTEKVTLLPFSSMFTDANRVMYTGDEKVAPAYQGFDWQKIDPRITRYTRTTMISAHLATLRDLPNDTHSEFIGTGLIQFKQSVDEGFYRRNVGVSPITWGEHAGLLLSVMGGKRNDVSDAEFVNTKAALYRPFMLGGTVNRPLLGNEAFYYYNPGAFESYQTWVTECGVASAIVRRDVLKANDKLKGDELDDAVEKALNERGRDGKFVDQVKKEARAMTPRGVAEEWVGAEIVKARGLKGTELDQAVTLELDKRFNPRSKDYDKDFNAKVEKEVTARLKGQDLDKFVADNVTQARLGFVQTALTFTSPYVPYQGVDAALESWGLRPDEIAKARREPRPKYLQ